MNNYQKERKDVFQNATFSIERKEAVLYEMNRQKKIMWQPIAAFVVVACIALFFILSNSPGNDITKSATDHSTLEGYFESMYNYDNEQDEKVTLLYQQQNIFQENDAVLIYTFSDSTNYHIDYVSFENNEWHMKGSTSIYDTKDENTPNFNIINFENSFIFVGGLGDDFSKTEIYVGNKEAIILNDKSIQPIWLQKGNSQGTPIFYKSGNNLTRILQFNYSFGSTTLPMLEAVGGDYTILQNKSNSMYGIDETYTDYPLIIDRAYYNEISPTTGDVVLIEKDGVQKLVRIKGIGPSIITVKQGSILTDGYFIEMNYMIAAENGNIHVDYSDMLEHMYYLNENQYFVQSDNWASEDFYEGIVMEEDIVGKVLGYSLLDIEPNWTNEEIDLYEQYKKELDDRLLVNIDPQTIFRLQKYAITHNDYPTAFALYDKDTSKISYEKWAESESTANKQVASMSKRHIYDAYLIQDAVDSKTGNETIFTNTNTSRKVATFIYKDGVYKVKYEQITDLTLN